MWRPRRVRSDSGLGRQDALKRADWTLLVIMIAAAVVAYVLDAVSSSELRSGPRVVTAVVLAFVPLAVWLAFFYQRDRFEPEPLHRVLTTVAVAALAAVVAESVISGVGAPTGFFGQLTVAVLWAGAIREWIKYAAVRLIAVESGDVGELADGIVYGTAAGLGYAAVVNLRFVLDASTSIELGPGFLWMAVVALAHASLGGVVGYFAAVDELRKTPAWWMPAGLALAAVGDGLFFTIRSSITNALVTADAGATFASWISVALVVVVVTGITMALTRVMAAEEAEPPT